jgi:type III restriction enzyme
VNSFPSGKTQADEDTYALIMRDKERLLSTDEPLRFIFSHTSLREGWDNPNIFQICTLNETRSQDRKRQEIGRGLRLPVNACSCVQVMACCLLLSKGVTIT